MFVLVTAKQELEHQHTWLYLLCPLVLQGLCDVKWMDGMHTEVVFLIASETFQTKEVYRC